MNCKSFPIKVFLFSMLAVFLFSGLAYAQQGLFRDKENCMLCHRYPTIGRFDKEGRKRIFYVSGKEFSNSVHKVLKCTDCHLGLDKIPHLDITKVDCSITCHIGGPGRKREYSHSDVVGKYEASVHGAFSNGKPKPYPEDLPTCTYCHSNRGYHGSGRSRGKRAGMTFEEMSVFRHPESRLRSQLDVIQLCGSCHEDEQKMSRHGIESTRTYKDTFHWEALKYGVTDAPDCISCHVPIGYSSHTIRPASDPLSSVNKDNRVRTCSNKEGIQTCHPDATVGFASGRVHKYGVKAELMTGGNGRTEEENGGDIMVEHAIKDVSEKERFQYNVLKLIKLIYKFLIGGTIGFMSVHQVLDYIRARKKHGKPH